MSIYRGRYYSASGCDSNARPGTDALMSWFLGAYGPRGAANLGTYACKTLGSGWSIHAERRAADMGTAPYGGVDSVWGWELANALRLHSAELGIQLLILGRKVWSCRYPDAGWRTYTGAHHGHIHAELTPSASLNLTTSLIQSTIGGKEDMGYLDWSAADRKALVRDVREGLSSTVQEGYHAETSGAFPVGTKIDAHTAVRQAWVYGKLVNAKVANIPLDVWNRVNPQTGETYGAMFRGVLARLDALAVALEAVVPGVLAGVQSAAAEVAATDVAELLEVRVRSQLDAMAMLEEGDTT